MLELISLHLINLSLKCNRNAFYRSKNRGSNFNLNLGLLILIEKGFLDKIKKKDEKIFKDWDEIFFKEKKNFVIFITGPEWRYQYPLCLFLLPARRQVLLPKGKLPKRLLWKQSHSSVKSVSFPWRLKFSRWPMAINTILLLVFISGIITPSVLHLQEITFNFMYFQF